MRHHTLHDGSLCFDTSSQLKACRVWTRQGLSELLVYLAVELGPVHQKFGQGERERTDEGQREEEEEKLNKERDRE
jgi:hypothetical protein